MVYFSQCDPWTSSFHVRSVIHLSENTVNLGPKVVTTNTEHYLEEFEECYNQGYTLRQFMKIPGIKTTIAVQDWTVKQPYQAIFAKPIPR